MVALARPGSQGKALGLASHDCLCIGGPGLSRPAWGRASGPLGASRSASGALASALGGGCLAWLSQPDGERVSSRERTRVPAAPQSDGIRIVLSGFCIVFGSFSVGSRPSGQGMQGLDRQPRGVTSPNEPLQQLRQPQACTGANPQIG